MTFFQAVGDGKTAGILVMLRQIIFYIPVVILLPLLFGGQSLWYVLPIIFVINSASFCLSDTLTIQTTVIIKWNLDAEVAMSQTSETNRKE